MIPLLLAFFFAPPAVAETADQIMAKVAQNQERSVEARTHYTFHQNVLTRLLHTNGKLDEDEMVDYAITPTPKGIKKEKLAFMGHKLVKGKVVEYHDPKESEWHMNVGEDDTGMDRDEIDRDLFPLTANKQEHYRFHLEGVEDYQGMPVYHITYTPKDDEWEWSGEVLVEQKDYQPVLVTSYLAKKLPLGVRVLLGTNLEQLGFKVTYKKLEDGVWFPSSYGGEFKLRAAFFFARRFGLSVVNSDFQKYDVSTKVTFSKVE